MNSRRRILAALLCAVFAVTVLLSGAYVTILAHHHCTGDHCPVCAVIAVVRQLLNSLSQTALCVSLLWRGVHLAGSLFRPRAREAAGDTLVSLKVRLSC